MTAKRRSLFARLSLAPLVALALALCAGCGSGGERTGSATRALRAAHASATRPTRPPARSTRAPVPAPGTLPQTHAYPPGSSAALRARMAALWAGVISDSPARALVAFFPRAAYVQLKAIAGAGSDWSGRLVHEYTLDIAAAHALLGAGVARAQLLAVHVPESYAHWVQAGVCANRLGYYELPNARVIFRDEGAVRSFGIASMISWRGEWYVVHLGAVLRAGEQGVLDEPAAGPGSSSYSGTC